jgi:rod shape-determining protein MreC
MSIYRPSPQRRVVLTGLLLASVTVLALDLRSSGSAFAGPRGVMASVLSPARRGASLAVRPITAFGSGLIHSRSIQDENERLRRENADLRSELDAAQLSAARAAELEKLLNLPLPRSVAKVGAEVYAPGASAFEWTVDIDAGSDDGVGVGNPVVSGDGLLGKIVSVQAHSAVVELLTDPSFGAAARLESSGESGIVHGHGTGPLTLDTLDPGVAVAKGERVVTSGGATSGFPSGLPIGTIRLSVAPDPSLQRTIIVDPLARVRATRFVSVLLYSGAARA